MQYSAEERRSLHVIKLFVAAHKVATLQQSVRLLCCMFLVGGCWKSLPWPMRNGSGRL